MRNPRPTPLPQLLRELRACTHCAAHLPEGPRPIVQAEAGARILIASQAPGRKVHASGVPFDDASGEKLRAWMGIDRAAFYDPRLVAIVPMGFCYPGRGASGDAPPRPECAPLWRARVLAALPSIELTLVIGQYAMAWHFEGRHTRVTDTVAAWREHGDKIVPLPHPSPRNIGWFMRHPWFETELVPALRARVSAIVDDARSARARP